MVARIEVSLHVVASQAWKCNLADGRGSGVAYAGIIWLHTNVRTGRNRNRRYNGCSHRLWKKRVRSVCDPNCVEWWGAFERRQVGFAVFERTELPRAFIIAVGRDGLAPLGIVEAVYTSGISSVKEARGLLNETGRYGC